VKNEAHKLEYIHMKLIVLTTRKILDICLIDKNDKLCLKNTI